MTKQTTINVFGLDVNVYDHGYNANGNRKQVIWFGSLYGLIEARISFPEYEPLKRTDAEYRHVLNALYRLGAKKYNNRKFGGGIVLAGANLATLGKDIEVAIDLYQRWYNAENIPKQTLDAAIDRTVCALPIVVKSTNSGITVKGEWSNGCPLKVNVVYDHNLTSTENYVRAAMMWCKKAEFKRWQIDGVESTLLLRSAYTALDANTRVFMYQIA